MRVLDEHTDPPTLTTHLLDQPHSGSIFQLILQRTDDNVELILTKHVTLSLGVRHYRGRTLGTVVGILEIGVSRGREGSESSNLGVVH